MVDYLADQTGRMTLDNVNASFDSSTGNLSGSITVNLFFMAGTSQTYTEPDAGSVAYGTDNIFGTIEQAAPDTDGNQTADGQAANQSAEGSDGQTDNNQEGENTEGESAPADDQGQS